MNWQDFFHMGGYAFYVWSSWGLTMAILLWQFIQPKRGNAKIKTEIRRQIKRQLILERSAENDSHTKAEQPNN